MKSTDLARRDREMRRARKKEAVLQRKMARDRPTVGDYINGLEELFFHDGSKIYNIDSSTEILEHLEKMKEDLPEGQWGNVVRKAVKKTGIAGKEEAVAMLNDLAGIEE